MSATVSADQQLLYETRVRTRYAALAAVAGTLLLLAGILQIAGPHTKVEELTLDLITATKRVGLDITAAVSNGLGSLALVGTLVFLWGAAKARNPDVQPYLRILAIVGGVLAVIAQIGYAIVIAVKAHQFVTTGSQTFLEAKHLTSGGSILVWQLLGQLAALLLAVSLVLISLQVMRVGLLTRFMGYLGVFAGILILFQIIQLPIVQVYWLFALAYLLSGRWPTGVPPAWRSGRAEKWPSGAEMRERRIQAAGGGRSKPKPAREPVAAASPAPSPKDSRTTAKRKRKRRK
jgi:hypothetical protein